MQDIKLMSEVVPSFDVVETRTKHDDILDLIYTRDPVTNMPVGEISMYLSDKTNDEVRKFIEQYILKEHSDGESVIPSSLRSEVEKLDDDFIMNTCRRRNETVEMYEQRCLAYLNELKSSDRIKAWSKQAKKNARNKEEDTTS